VPIVVLSAIPVLRFSPAKLTATGAMEGDDPAVLHQQAAAVFDTMLDRIAGDRPAGALRKLAAAVEPVKGYARDAGRRYKSSTPLNRMVDATPAESDAARQFSQAVDALVAGDRTAREAVGRRLAEWRDQHGALEPVFTASALGAEVEPLSRDVAALAAAGLEALVYVESGQPAPQAWTDAQSQLLERARLPRVELLIAILDPVRKLVEAAGRRGAQ